MRINEYNWKTQLEWEIEHGGEMELSTEEW